MTTTTRRAAIIQGLSSGECFLATLDGDDQILAMSIALPTTEATDDCGRTDWDLFRDADTEDVDGLESVHDHYKVCHRFSA